MTIGIDKIATAAALIGFLAFAAPVTGWAQKAPAGRTHTATVNANAKADEFSTEAAAKAHCGSGAVVWANLSSHVYHFAGSRDYGKAKRGAYMCEASATKDGFRAAKNDKHP